MHSVANTFRDWMTSGMYSKEACGRLKTWQEKIAEPNIEVTDRFVKRGNPKVHIVPQAAAINCDLILVGSGSHKAELGSVAKHVVHYAHCSVWVAHTNTIKNILCPVDGSKKSLHSLAKAIELAKLYDASLSVVNIVSHTDFNPIGMDDDEVSIREKQVLEKSKKGIEQKLQAIDFGNINVKHHYAWGVPYRVILDLAIDAEHDLIVMGATGKNILAQKLLGSTAEKVLQHTPCSILIVR